MRIINVNTITQNIKDMCIKANHFLAEDMDQAMKHALDTEQSPLGRQILDQLQDNLKIAAEDMIPICQDTGMAVVFLKVGQDVHFEGGSLEDAVNEGVRQGYVEGFLRKSVVGDPIIRENTKDNTPAVIHYSIVPGDKVEIKNGKVYINDSETPLDDSFVPETPLGSFGPYEVPDNCYFMMGDNRNNSKDSRYWTNTFVRFDQIVGKAEIRYFPSIKLLN